MALTPTTMRRGFTLAALTIIGIVAALVFAQPLPSTPIQVEKVRDNLYLLRGGGVMLRAGAFRMPASGNTIAFLTRTGVVLVDTKVPESGRPILEALGTVTNLPVTMIINTHFHSDHTGSNPDFPASVEVVAQTNTARLMQAMPPATGGRPEPNIFTASKGVGLPTKTFDDRLTIGSGNERIDLYYFGQAHTGGDAWVFFPAQRVLHTGDVFGHKTVPIVDTDNGGSGPAYSETIARAVATLTGVETVVSGHYPGNLTMADLKTYGEFIREFVQAVRTAKQSGQTLDDFNRTWTIPDRFLREGYLPIPLRADTLWNATN